MKRFDVVGICNALVDILIKVDDQDLQTLGMNKGIMHLVDANRQSEVLAHFLGHAQAVELGGSALNAIRTLASLGKKTVFAGMVSDDAFGKKIKERMYSLGIVEKLGATHEPTGSCVILVTPDGERTMNTNLGASRLYTEEQVPYAEIEEARVLHFCGYQWDTEGQKRAVGLATEHAKAHNTLVSFDLADPFVVGRYRERFVDVIREDADIVFCNREEAKMMFGGDAENAAQQITALGAIAVVKLGADGALVRQGNKSWHIPAVKTTVVDTTAAGDMFAAGFLYGYTSAKPLDVCGKIAATLAADVISRVGTEVSSTALDKAQSL